MSRDIEKLYEDLKSEEDNINPMESAFILMSAPQTFMAILERLDQIKAVLGVNDGNRYTQ